MPRLEEEHLLRPVLVRDEHVSYLRSAAASVLGRQGDGGCPESASSVRGRHGSGHESAKNAPKTKQRVGRPEGASGGLGQQRLLRKTVQAQECPCLWITPPQPHSAPRSSEEG